MSDIEESSPSGSNELLYTWWHKDWGSGPVHGDWRYARTPEEAIAKFKATYPAYFGGPVASLHPNWSLMVVLNGENLWTIPLPEGWWK